MFNCARVAAADKDGLRALDTLTYEQGLQRQDVVLIDSPAIRRVAALTGFCSAITRARTVEAALSAPS